MLCRTRLLGPIVSQRPGAAKVGGDAVDVDAAFADVDVVESFVDAYSRASPSSSTTVQPSPPSSRAPLPWFFT